MIMVILVKQGRYHINKQEIHHDERIYRDVPNLVSDEDEVVDQQEIHHH